MSHEFVAVIDFGGQANQLLARRIRELHVYCEVFSKQASFEEIYKHNPTALLLVGMDHAGEFDTPTLPYCPLDFKVPILAVGTPSRMVLKESGADLGAPQTMEQDLVTYQGSPLLKGLTNGNAYIGTYQQIKALPEGMQPIAHTRSGDIIAAQNEKAGIYVLQFHPEQPQTEYGIQIIEQFLTSIAQLKQDWSMPEYALQSVEALKQQIGPGKVLLALSGGVDSSVVAALLEKAVGNQLYCIFVDTGLMRLNEGDEVQAAFENSGMHFIRVNAEERFLTRLAGVTDPETKRKIIGEEFIRVFEEEAKKIGTVDFFAQGTIYPDIIESQTSSGKVLKSHHNVGGLPEHVDFKEIIEPLKALFKDEVRSLGKELGLPEYLVQRQPFPGPGLSVRVIGEVTKEKLDILRKADAIFREEIASAELDQTINQYFAILTSMRSVGITNEERTYDYTLALRGVVTTDFVTAQWARIPYDVLDLVAGRIVQEVGSINRIVYDITSKPPATIEWE